LALDSIVDGSTCVLVGDIMASLLKHSQEDQISLKYFFTKSSHLIQGRNSGEYLRNPQGGFSGTTWGNKLKVPWKDKGTENFVLVVGIKGDKKIVYNVLKTFCAVNYLRTFLCTLL
jgi:hypothetical protein